MFKGPAPYLLWKVNKHHKSACDIGAMPFDDLHDYVPVHACSFIIIDLHPVHSCIASTRNRILCYHHRERYEFPCVLRPRDWLGLCFIIAIQDSCCNTCRRQGQYQVREGGKPVIPGSSFAADGQLTTNKQQELTRLLP